MLRVEPASGPSGTLVLLRGAGAPPASQVHLLVAAWDGGGECAAGGDARVETTRLDTVVSNTDGSFVVAHEAAQIGPEHRGFRYLANVASEPPERRVAPLVSRPVCFVFIEQ